MTLKQLRQKKGLTQAEAAAIAGLSRRGYQNLEQEKYKKLSKTYYYAFSCLENYQKPRAASRPLRKAFLKKVVDETLSEFDVVVAFLYGDYASKSPTSSSEVALLLEGDLTRLDQLALEQELSVRLEKPIRLKRFNECEHSELLRILAGAEKIYPL